MGFVNPPYNIDPRMVDKVYQELSKAMAEKFTIEKQKELTYRPIRPNEINVALTTVTRVYNSVTGFAGVFGRILGAAADVITPSGNAFIIFGWLFLDDPTGANPIGLGGVGQVVVEGTVRNEVALKPIDMMPERCLLTFEQVIMITENTSWTIQIKGAAAAQVIAYPLGYRIGPMSQLNQG